MATEEEPAVDRLEICGASSKPPHVPGHVHTTCHRRAGHEGPHANGRMSWTERLCAAAKMFDETEAWCMREFGHEGAHDNLAGLFWSAAPPLGPVPERFRYNVVPGTEGLPGAGYYSQPLDCGAGGGGSVRTTVAGGSSGGGVASGSARATVESATVENGGISGAGGGGGTFDLGELRFPIDAAAIDQIFGSRRAPKVYSRDQMLTAQAAAAGEAPAKKPLGVSVDPGDSPELLLAGLVACGRALGRIEHELAQRQHWQKVIDRAREFGPVRAVALEATPEQWRAFARTLFEEIREAAEAPQSEPTRPIQERAEALAILILQGRRRGVTPNFLIRAGAVLEVLRAAWRNAQRGGA